MPPRHGESDHVVVQQGLLVGDALLRLQLFAAVGGEVDAMGIIARNSESPFRSESG
jgi:hypothetical protein